MYTTTGSSLVRFDTTTGATTTIGNFSGGSALGLAFGPDGTAYTLLNSQETLATVNLATAAITAIGGPGVTTGYALDFSPSGDLYAILPSNTVFRVSTATGAFTQVGTVSGTSSIMDIAFTPSGALYAVNGNNYVYALNPTTFAAYTAYTTPLSGLMGLAADNAGHLVATSYASPSKFETIDIGTGTITSSGTLGASWTHGGDILTPEPASLALLGSALFGIALIRRRKAAR